jgi:hypothetical protein
MKTKILIATALAALAAVPAAASAKTLHFSGKAVGPKPDANMKITFDVVASQGRPKTIENIQVTDLDYRCHFGGETERDLRVFADGTFAKSGKFDVAEEDLPPAYKNDVFGKFAYPKKGKRKKPTITGTLLSEFGYGPTRDEYNCLGGEDFKATPNG